MDIEQTSIEQTRAIRSRIKAMLKHEERKLEKQRADTLEAGQYVRYGQIADSLLADPTAAPRGTVKAEIINIHTSEFEEAALNPAFDAMENAELLYRKARKGKRGYDTAAAMMTATENKIGKLRDVLIGIEEIVKESSAADDPAAHAGEDLERVREIAKDFLPPDDGGAGKKKIQEVSVPFKKYTVDGWDIYLGKNSTQNDELSVHFAKPWDIWMHVAGYAGSHVIIRCKKGAPPPSKEVIQKTAQIAVWNSKAKHTSFAEVHITEARFVRKRRHAPPGEVIAERCKTMRVEPKDPQELFC